MPKKMKLENLTVKSFVTKEGAEQTKGGIIGPSGAYTCIVYCTTGPTYNDLCSNPCSHYPGCN